MLQLLVNIGGWRPVPRLRRTRASLGREAAAGEIHLGFPRYTPRRDRRRGTEAGERVEGAGQVHGGGALFTGGVRSLD